MTPELQAEWDGILALRRRFHSSGQDGRDFAVWLQWRMSSQPRQLPQQLELFA